MHPAKHEGGSPPVYCWKTNGILLRNERAVAPLSGGKGALVRGEGVLLFLQIAWSALSSMAWPYTKRGFRCLQTPRGSGCSKRRLASSLTTWTVRAGITGCSPSENPLKSRSARGVEPATLRATTFWSTHRARMRLRLARLLYCRKAKGGISYKTSESKSL